MALSQKNKHKPVSRLSVTQKCLSETFHCKAYHTSQFTTGKILLFVHTIHSLWLQQELRSDQISRSVVSDSLRPHELQHTRPPCPSPTPRVHPDSRPSSHWCHPAIASSAVPFSSCPKPLQASESFPMSQLFASLRQCRSCLQFLSAFHTT